MIKKKFLREKKKLNKYPKQQKDSFFLKKIRG